MAFNDPFHLRWGPTFSSPSLPGNKLRAGIACLTTEMSDDAVTLEVRLGYWSEKDSEANERWTVTVQGDGVVYLSELGSSEGSSKSSKGGVSTLLGSHTVKLPRKAVDYTVTVEASCTLWGQAAYPGNGRLPRLTATVPRNTNNLNNLTWGRWFVPPGHPGNRMRVGLHAWAQEVKEESVTVRCRFAYWSDMGSYLGYGESWTVSLEGRGGKLEGHRSANGDMKDPQVESAKTTAYIEDFTVEAPRLASAYDAVLRADAYFWGQPIKSSNGLAPAVSVRIPAIALSKPDAPSGLTATLEGMAALLKWEDGSDPDKGKPWASVGVYRSDNGAQPKLVATLRSALSWRDGTLARDGAYEYTLKASNAAGSSTASAAASVETPPSAVAGLSARRASDSSISLTWGHPSGLVDSFSVERRGEAGTWSQVESVPRTGPAMDFLDDACPAETVRYRVRAVSGGGESPWVQTEDIRYTCAPEAPAVMGVAPGSVVSSADERALEWSPNHPDASPQTAARVRLDGKVIELGADARSHRLRGLADGEHSVEVATKGEGPDWGPWSAPIAFTVATPPAVEVVRPAAHQGPITAMPIRVEWTCSSNYAIVRQTLAVERVGGGSPRVFDVVAGEAFELDAGAADIRSGDAYRLTVTAVDGFGYASSDSVEFTVRFTPPALPAVSLRNDEEGLCTYLWCEETERPASQAPKAGAFQAGEPLLTALDGLKWKGAGHSPTDHFEIWREDASGALERVARDLGARVMAIDPTPPLNAAYRYRVDAVSPDGERSSCWVANALDSHDAVALNYGSGLGSLAKLRYDLDGSASESVGGEGYRFPGAGSSERWGGAELPVWYPSAQAQGDFDVAGTVVALDDALAWQRAFRCGGVGLYRSLFGERIHVAAQGSVGVSHGDGRQWNVTATMKEVAGG